MVEPWGERLGGAEAMLQGILEGARESGHEVEVVFLQDGPWPREVSEMGLKVFVLRVGRMRQVGNWFATVVRLARIFRSRRPDVILDWSAKMQFYGAPAAVLAGMRHRLTWWQQAIPKRDWLDGTATLLPAAGIFCYSGAAREAQERLRPRRRTFVVNAGSPEPPADEPVADIALPGDVPIVGLVGRLQVWKGQDQLLRAHALLRERGLRMHTLIVGGDSWGLSPEYAGSLEPLARELGISDEVTFTGEVPDAGPYIRRMDVIVNASDPEPFGIVILEGMAREVAVAAVRSGGPAEFVQDGVTGVLARSGSPEDLADALASLLQSAELRAQIAAAGHASYLSDFTTAAMRRRFFAAVEQVPTGR